MTSYALARPVPGSRIVPFGGTRLASDVLANGRPAFRITQRFDDVNPAFPQSGAHRATDLGNFYCGDQVYAVWGGKAKTIGPDQYGALGIIIDHGTFSSVYWHLNAFSIARGDAVPVAKGQQIGIVGKTGLGAVCHLHFEIKVNGVRIDPERYLLGAPLVLEDDMNLPTDAGYLASGIVYPGVNLRVTAESEAGAIQVDKATGVQVLGIRRNKTAYTVAGRADNDWYVVMLPDGSVREVAKLLVSSITATGYLASIVPLPAADCSAQEQALAQIKTKLARATTSAQGAAQAATATVEALR